MKTTSRSALVLMIAAVSGCEPDDIQHAESDSGGEALADEDFPQRLAEAYCTQLFACDPVTTCTETGTPYASEADCIAGEQQALTEARTAARDAGLSFDAQCVEDTIARYAAIGCDNIFRLAQRDRELFGVCAPYFGTIAEGEGPCEESVASGLSKCGQGLVCYEDGGTCVTGAVVCDCDDGFACEEGALGAECVPILTLGEPCFAGMNDLGSCGLEGVCWIEEDETTHEVISECRARAPLGTDCTDGTACSSYECDGTCKPGSPWLCEYEAAPRRWR